MQAQEQLNKYNRIQLKNLFQIIIWQHFQKHPHPFIVKINNILYPSNALPIISTLKTQNLYDIYNSIHHLQQQKIFNISTALVLGLQGLCYMHMFGFIHSDINLKNLNLQKHQLQNLQYQYSVKINSFQQFILQEIPRYQKFKHSIQLQAKIQSWKNVLNLKPSQNSHSLNHITTAYSKNKWLDQTACSIVQKYFNQNQHNQNNQLFKNCQKNQYQYQNSKKNIPPKIQYFSYLSNINIGLKDDHLYYFSILQFILQKQNFYFLKNFANKITKVLKKNKEIMPLSTLKQYDQLIENTLKIIYDNNKPIKKIYYFSETQIKSIMLLVGQCLIPNQYPKIYKKHFIIKYLKIVKQNSKINEFKLRNRQQDIAQFYSLSLQIMEIQKNIANLIQEQFNLSQNIDQWIKQKKIKIQKIQKLIQQKLRNAIFHQIKQKQKIKDLQKNIQEWRRLRRLWLRRRDYLVQAYGIQTQCVQSFFVKVNKVQQAQQFSQQQ